MAEVVALLQQVPEVVWGTLLGSALSIAVGQLEHFRQRRAEDLRVRREVILAAADYLSERVQSLVSMCTYEDGKFQSNSPSSSGLGMRVGLVASVNGIRAASDLDAVISETQMRLLGAQLRLMPLLRQQESLQARIERIQGESEITIGRLEEVARGEVPPGAWGQLLLQRMNRLEADLRELGEQRSIVSTQVLSQFSLMYDELLRGLERIAEAYVAAAVAVRRDLGIRSSGTAVERQMKADVERQRLLFEALRSEVGAALASASASDEQTDTTSGNME